MPQDEGSVFEEPAGPLGLKSLQSPLHEKCYLGLQGPGGPSGAIEKHKHTSVTNVIEIFHCFMEAMQFETAAQ